jgi:TPR repeat protein
VNCAAQAIATKASPAVAIVEKVTVSQQPESIEIAITVSTPFVPQGVRFTSPDRLVFDFPGYELAAFGHRIAVDRGPVKEVRVSLFQSSPPIARVVIDCKQAAKFDLKAEENRVLIRFPIANSDQPLAQSTRSRETARENAVPVQQSQSQPERLPDHPLSRVSAYNLQAKARNLKLENLQTLEEKAQAGDAEAETTLALAYHDAILLKRDDAEALRLLHKAADQGFMAAEESLGIFSETGIGMPQPAPEEALDWYKKAVQQGSMDAATNLALMYSGGIGVPKNATQSIIWFRRAAEGGDATAQYNLALIYAQGRGVPKDYKESQHWLTLAAEQNVLPAILDLASFYLHPPEGENTDVQRAIHYYEKAAELGSASADTVLGNILASAAQGKPDYQQAVKWYQKAADQGQAEAEFGLAVLYESGQGVPLDLQAARRLFTAAADKGFAEAQYELGTLWEEGKGDAADPTMAQHYFQLAAEQGNTRAQFRLGQLLAQDHRSRADRVSAYKWLMLAQSIPESTAVLANLRKSMSSDEVGQGDRAVDDWRISHRGKGK